MASTADILFKQLNLDENKLHVTESVSSATARNHVRHVWRLERYLQLADYQMSACFSAPGSYKKWCLGLSSALKKDCNGHIQVHLRRISLRTDPPNDTVFLRVWILATDGGVLNRHECLGKVEDSIGFDHFIERKYLHHGRKTLSAEGTFTLACDVFEMTNYQATPSHLLMNYSSSKKEAHGFSQELLVRCEGSSEDFVTLIGKDNVRVEANQFILGARSRVLRAMLDSPLKVQRTKLIELEDIDGEVLKQMVKFINTDTVDNLDRLAEPLLVIADRYQVLKLKMLCEEHLMKLISHSTVSHLQSLAEMASAPMLKNCCRVFSWYN